MAALDTIDPNVLLNGYPSPPSRAFDDTWKSASTPLRELTKSDGELSDLFSDDSNRDQDSSASDDTATDLNDDGDSNVDAPILYKGRLYDNIDQVKASIGILSLRQGGASVKVVASNSHKLILECCEAGEARQGCGFRVYLKPVPHSKKYEIRRFSEVHSCSVDGIPRRTMLKQSWFVLRLVSTALAMLSV